MQADVVGTAVASVKHESLVGSKLLIIQPLMADGAASDGDPLLAVDGIGARRGDKVIVTSDGRYAREVLAAEKTPVRWSVIGICD